MRQATSTPRSRSNVRLHNFSLYFGQRDSGKEASTRARLINMWIRDSVWLGKTLANDCYGPVAMLKGTLQGQHLHELPMRNEVLDDTFLSW